MRRSLLRPRRCPGGIWPSSGNIPATLLSVGAAIAPDNLHYNLHLHGDAAVLRNVGAMHSGKVLTPLPSRSECFRLSGTLSDTH